MGRFALLTNWSERQQLLGGVIALLLATACVATLGTLGFEGGIGAVLVGLAGVVLFVVATLSIGTSETARV